MDDECLHIMIYDIQTLDQLKTWIILQYGILEAVSKKKPVFLCCLKLSSCLIWLYRCSLQYSICVCSNLKNCWNTLVKFQIILKYKFTAHTDSCSSFFFFFLFQQHLCNNGWCWQAAMGTNVIHSLCRSVLVPWIVGKCCCLWVSPTLRICVYCKMHLILLHLFWFCLVIFISVNPR